MQHHKFKHLTDIITNLGKRLNLENKMTIKADMISVGTMYTNTTDDQILTVLSKIELPKDLLLISCLVYSKNGEQKISKIIYKKNQEFPGFMHWRWRHLL